ncbi:putative reverse transcriptase domain-containing protein [Tanacetum coccineum]
MVEIEMIPRLHEVSTTQLQGNGRVTISSLTWWNSHKRTVGIEAAFSMSWRELMKLMAEERVEKFIGGLPDNIQGNVIAIEPTKLQDTIRIANNLIDQKLNGYVVKNAKNKIRLEVNQRDNCGQQPPFKRQNVGAGKKTKEARGKAYVMGGGEANPELNIVMGTFLINNHYASMLFDSGADRSFVLTTFSTLHDITPDTLDVSYAVELADKRISKTNTVLRGYTLGLLGHPFNIDLMPVELGSFDVIIGMDCDKGKKSKWSIISCTKTQKYIKRGCPIFLAQVTKKETEDKLKEKRLKDVPIVRDFLEVFPEDLPGLPPMRQAEIQKNRT